LHAYGKIAGMKKIIALAIVLFTTRLTAQTNPIDFLSAIETAVNLKGGGCPGMFAYTRGNALPQGWIEQTPNIWGKQPSDLVPWAHSKEMAVHMADMIAKAETVVDITTLAPPPDGWWAGEIIRGLRAVARTGKPVIVRILIGVYPTGPDVKADQYLRTLGVQLEDIPGNHLIIYAVAQRTALHSWNHSKIVAVDGKYVMTGGHNLWPHDYLGPYPAHDLSMRAEGPAAYAAFTFANTLWDWVRHCNGGATCPYQGQSYRWTVGHVIKEAPPGIELAQPAAVGNVPMIAAGRAGKNLFSCNKDWNPSDTAMLAVFDHAQKSIKLSQQDVVLSKCGHDFRKMWEDGWRSIAAAMVRGVDVQIVLSNYHAQTGASGEIYSTCVKPDETWRLIRSYVEAATGKKGDAVRELMKKRLHLTSLRFGPDSNGTWSNGWPFANHAKMFIVDDSVFYIGSSNMYSSELQEFGYFAQNPEAVNTLLAEYWNPMWKYSSATEYRP
jgi:phosphatidylserine/phosphatidylglycerophosphate/cardiolipin synthase-like enzyme